MKTQITNLLAKRGLHTPPCYSHVILSAFLLFTLLMPVKVWGETLTFAGHELMFFHKNQLHYNAGSNDSPWEFTKDGAHIFIAFCNNGSLDGDNLSNDNSNGVRWSDEAFQWEGDIYAVKVPAGTYSNCKIVRKNSNDSGKNTNNVWNKTAKAGLQSGKNYISTSTGSSLTLSVYTPKFYLTGCSALTGADWGYQGNNTQYTGSVTKTNLPAGTYQFKLNPIQNYNDWGHQINFFSANQSGSNVTLSRAGANNDTQIQFTLDKQSDVTIAFNGYGVTVNTVSAGPATVSGDYSLRGDLWLNSGGGWANRANGGEPHLVISNDETTASVSYVMPVAQARLTLCKDGADLTDDKWSNTSTLNKTNFNDTKYSIAPQSTIKKYTFTYVADGDKLIGTVSDYDVVKAGWDVYIDNNKVGTTDANGEYTTDSPLNGAHTIYLRKSGATSEIQGINWFGGLYIDKTNSNVNWDGEGSVYYDAAKFSDTKFPINGTTDAKGKFVLSSSSNIRVTFDGGKITINTTWQTDELRVGGANGNASWPNNWGDNKSNTVLMNLVGEEKVCTINRVKGTGIRFKIYNFAYNPKTIIPIDLIDDQINNEGYGTENKNRIISQIQKNGLTDIKFSLMGLADVTVHYNGTKIWLTAERAQESLSGNWYIMGGHNEWSKNDPEHQMTISAGEATKTYYNVTTGFDFKVYGNGDEHGWSYYSQSKSDVTCTEVEKEKNISYISIPSFGEAKDVTIHYDGLNVWVTAQDATPANYYVGGNCFYDQKDFPDWDHRVKMDYDGEKWYKTFNSVNGQVWMKLCRNQEEPIPGATLVESEYRNGGKTLQELTTWTDPQEVQIKVKYPAILTVYYDGQHVSADASVKMSAFSYFGVMSGETMGSTNMSGWNTGNAPERELFVTNGVASRTFYNHRSTSGPDFKVYGKYSNQTPQFDYNYLNSEKCKGGITLRRSGEGNNNIMPEHIPAPCNITIKFDGRDIWMEASHTVTVKDGETTISTQEVIHGDGFAMPATPDASNRVFKGWYTNPDGTGEPYNFESPITSDITVYAIWWNFYLMGNGNNTTWPDWSKDKKFKLNYDPATETYSISFANFAGSKQFKLYDDTKVEYKGNLITPFTRKNEELMYLNTDDSRNNISFAVQGVANITIYYKPTNPEAERIWMTAEKQNVSVDGEQWHIMGSNGSISLHYDKSKLITDGNHRMTDSGNGVVQRTYPNYTFGNFWIKVMRQSDKTEFGCQYLDASSCRGLVMSHDNGAGDDNINVKSIPAGSNVNFFFDGTKIWGTATHTVTFVTNGGSEVAPREVIHNERISEASIGSVKQGATATWYTDEALTQRFDFNTQITANITLYAKWKVMATLDGAKFQVLGLSQQNPNTINWPLGGTTITNTYTEILEHQMTITNGVARKTFYNVKFTDNVTYRVVKIAEGDDRSQDEWLGWSNINTTKNIAAANTTISQYGETNDVRLGINARDPHYDITICVAVNAEGDYETWAEIRARQSFTDAYCLTGDFNRWAASSSTDKLTKVDDYEQTITHRFSPQLYSNGSDNYKSDDNGQTQRLKLKTAVADWNGQLYRKDVHAETSDYMVGSDDTEPDNSNKPRICVKVTEPTDVTFTVWKDYTGAMKVSIVAVPAPKHTITYYANGAASGTVPTDGTQYEDGSSVTVLGNTGNLAKVGYTFGGWNTKADGSGTAYAADNQFNIAANTNLYAQWTPNNPGVVTISGAYHIFTGETLTLTASVQNELPATGVTYTWKLGGQAIQGQNTATLTINNVSYSNAGSYTCTVDNHGASSTSAGHQVKMLKLYLKDDGARDLSNHTFVRVAETNTAYADIELHENTTYKFRVADGVGNAYGNSGTMTDQNHTNWDLDKDQDCGIKTTTTGTYRFRIDYTDLVHLKMTVDYPVYDQAAGHPIYFDKGTLNWSKVHYRIGAATTITGDQTMQPVPGTARLYQTTTKEYNGYLAWHLANNQGWTGSNSIYKTNTNSDQYAITQSTQFLRTNVGEQGVTVRCTDDHSTGADDQNNNCEFYSTTVTSGLLTHNVTVENYTHGTITLAWTDINGQSQSSHVSTNGLAHTCLLTITAVPDDGCRLGSLTVDGQTITSGQTLTLENDVTISVDFVLERTVHFETNGGSTIDDVVIRDGQTIGAKSTTRDNCVFLGWYSDAALTKPFDIENAPITTNCTLYAKWRVPFTPGEKLYFSSEGTDWSNANAHICALFYKVDDLEYCLNTNSTNRNSAYFNGVNLNNAQSGLYTYATEMTRLNGSNWYEVTVPYDNAGAVRLIRISSTDTQYMWAFAQRKDAEDRQGASTIKLTSSANKGATSVWVDDAPFCTISFEVFGHADAVSAVSDLAKGGSLPSLPRVNNITAGYSFDGWYLENTYETPVTTDTKFAKSSTVYAKFRYTPSASQWSQISPAPIASDVVVLTGSCTVDVNTAVATDVLLAPGVTLTIQPRGALTLTGRVLLQDAGGNTSAVNDPSRILIQSSATGTGTLIHGDRIGQTMATVELYSKAYSVKIPETGKTKKYWQYIGIPVERIMALDGFYNAMTYQYDETAGWIKKTSYEDLENFWGIGLTFNGGPGNIYTLPGTLASTAEKQINLTYTGGVGEGMHLIGNSWTAPIQIDQFTDEDFGEAEKTIYIYNTGRDDEGGAGQGSSPGQWTAIPIKLSQHPNSVWAGPKVIPAMQAFEVNTNNPTTLTLNYDRLVRGQSTDHINDPLYTPARHATTEEAEEVISMMRISVAEEETMTNTDIYLVEGAGFSTGYDDGWDGRYSECDDRSAAFYSLSEEGNMAVNALPELEGNVLGFVPNKSRVYTISFGYDGQETYYLNDLQARQSTLIEEGSTYMFVAGDGDMVERFAISKTPLRAPSITTGVDGTEAGTWVQKVIVEDNLYIIRDGHMYNATGVMVK